MKRLLFTPLLALLLSCAGPFLPPGKSAYNQGVEAWRAKNYAEAREQWSRSLAEGGPDEALNNLGYLLYYGMGGVAQPEKAVELWRKGAALGVSEAQWHLGTAYEEGKGVAASPVQAFAWYLCAAATASQANEDLKTERAVANDAVRSAGRLAPRLTAAEMAQAEALAGQLIAKYSKRLSTDSARN